jgi:hypothetical protein
MAGWLIWRDGQDGRDDGWYEYPQELGSMRTPWNAVLKYQTISGRLKSKLDEKRKSAEVESIENGYSIEKTSDKNDFVFKLNKDGEQAQNVAETARRRRRSQRRGVAGRTDRRPVQYRRQHRPETETKKRRRTRTK